MRGFAWLGAGAIVIACVGSPVVAVASCPRLASGTSGAADLISFQETIARLTAREGRLSDTQMWEAFKSGAITIPPLGLSPVNGPAPLTVIGRWFWHPVEQPVSVEFDADSDGRPELSGRDYGELRHTYRDPGQWPSGNPGLLAKPPRGLVRAND